MFLVVCVKSLGDEERERKKVGRKRRARLLMDACDGLRSCGRCASL